ncbi:alpha-mannosidase 2-like [Cotesia glomerata]|uniref:alpha-mannosidase 2-like n=1 Tax=Cotesia glomerata TaxID=32391 RepID=UPI001D012FE1|nr:alpha-mannosidase 2-like [Cotesia glomerata]XP_044575987.1 alpha-mannosidase 2-like [Cotesia glomerata]
MKSSIHRNYQLFPGFHNGKILACFFMNFLLFSPKFGLGKPSSCPLQSNGQCINSRNDQTRNYFVNNSSNNQLDWKESLTCSFGMNVVPQNDIQMLNLYRELEFDDSYGGVWDQGFDITYSPNQWSPTNKLKVFVVPHSHNDPGWLITFEEYYKESTQNILNNMVVKLPEDKRRKFIWAEISFFKLWWDEQSEEIHEIVRKLIADGQLEIVSGGWVMPDEAVSHWMAQLTQLTEGHQWLKKNLNYRPTSSWAIDPFGLSPTMPYLLKNSGFDNVLIQRVHYAVKKHFAQDKTLEFRWRQLWDTTGSTEIFTHMMPFSSYSIEKTCGPNPNVCMQFDFSKLYSEEITDENVAERASLLLDQYRKKSQLYRTNVVLVPLGDDFRYNKSFEWDAQYNNYQKLFDYMNANTRLNVDVKFGTLTDYFTAVRSEKEISEFPSLSGDFFTYSDKHRYYWSGYYTSRPFHKRLDRMLLGALRGAEIISAIALIHGHQQDFGERIIEARELHSLFQHHDGITGTARNHVVVDYADKMLSALKNLDVVTQQSAAHLLKNTTVPNLHHESVYLSLDEVRYHYKDIKERKILKLNRNETLKKVIIYNSLPRQRTKVQTLIVSTPFVQVVNRNGDQLQCQISPVWVEPEIYSREKYELSFLVTVPGFGLEAYSIFFIEGDKLPENVHLADVTLFNTVAPLSNKFGSKDIKIFPSVQEFSITQQNISASFAKSGLLKSIRTGDITTSVDLEFIHYKTFQSGAYLFTPYDPQPYDLYEWDYHVVHLLNGPILSRVFIQLPQVTQTYTLFNSTGSDGLGLHISNHVDITNTFNFELVMRLRTNISSGDEFFTDLNGLNMIRRQRFLKLPIQANYYPLPAAGYIQDDKARLTILSGQPLGAASMAPGQFEIMQDRRLNQDDWRGLAQEVKDNLVTNHDFMLVLEKKKQSCSSFAPDHPSGALSLGGLLASEELLHPLVAMYSHSSDNNCKDHFSPVNFDLPVDLAIASFRVFSVPKGKSFSLDKALGMVLHRQSVDVCWGDDLIASRFKLSSNGEINVRNLLNLTQEWSINEASLTFNSVGASLQSPIIELCPHKLSAILLSNSNFN